MSLLRAEGLSISIAGETIVDGIDFDIEAGETLALVGESGSGKTLTALSLLGLLPPGARVSGRLHFLDRDLTALDEAGWRPLRGREISMVFQDPGAVLNPVLSIGTQLVEAIRAHQRLDRRAAGRLAHGLLERVGLHDPAARLRDYPHQLSGGMRQRVVIAMAVANQPRLIVADEATTALDVTVQAQIVELMQSLCRERGSSLLWISHDLALVARIARRVLVMRAGRIVEHGATGEVLLRPAHPYTRSLLAAHPAALPPRPAVRRTGDHAQPDRDGHGIASGLEDGEAEAGA